MRPLLVVMSVLGLVSATAAAQTVEVGAWLGCDSAGLVNAEVPTSALRISWWLPEHAHLAVEASVGYRRVSFFEFGGSHSDRFDMRQIPISLGASYRFGKGESLQGALGFGGVASLTKAYLEQYSYPGRITKRSQSTVVLGAYGEARLHVWLSPRFGLGAELRGVLNPVSDTGAAREQSYYAAGLGLLSRPF